MPMNEKQLKLLDKLRGSELRSPEELAELLKKENIQFSAKDLSFWGMILATRFRYGGIAHVPEWLAEVFCVLSTADSAKAICDPCAGVGILIGILREATQATEAIAGTRNQLEYSLGKVLVPEATWKLGDPLEMIDQMREDVDLMASILPMGVRVRAPLTLTGPQGDRLELLDDLGN